jgi:hypothetical protein
MAGRWTLPSSGQTGRGSTGDDPEAVRGAQFFRALGGGGVGAGFDYMGGNSFHWDINNPRVWSDSGGINDTDARGAVSWQAQLAEAEQLGIEGLLQQAGIAPPVTSGAGIAVASRSDSGDPMVGLADAEAQRAGVDADLFRRVVTQESNWDPSATSPAGARGLAQVMPNTGANPGFGVAPIQSIDDPQENLRFGADYLAAMLQRYDGDEERALVAYNAGPGVADDWDGNRASLPTETQGYLRNIVDGEGGSVPTASAMNGDVMPPQTAIRTPGGQLEMRPLDIFTSRYDVIRQNAALGTYSAGVLNNASLAMADLQRQFPLDPDGFRQAAQGYVSRMMENAPAPIREQLLSDLQLEAGRSLNGVIAARYDNTMQRARAEIGARIETNALEYSTLLAQGDTEGAAVARANLESALRYRETLPGSTWGPEQTNMLLAGAERRAATMRDDQRSSRMSEIGSQLSDIRRESLDGRESAHTSVLFSEEAQQHPEYLATLASYEFGQAMRHDFARMTPQQRVAAVEAERGRPVDDYDRGFLSAMEGAHERLLELERTDPVAAAGARGFAITPLDPSDPQTFLQGLMQRRQLADRMEADGFADAENARIFTNAEREMLGEMLGEGSDPETREQIASALILTQEENVVAAMRELGAEESVAQLADVARATSNARLLTEGLQGSALRQAGISRPGTVNDMMQEPEVAQVITEGLGNLPAAMRGTVLEMALDLLAFRAQGAQEVTPEQRVEAVQSALGRMANGSYGGVAEVFGGMTLLPPTMTPSQLTSAFESRLTNANLRVTDDGQIELLGPTLRGDMRRPTDDQALGTYGTVEEAQASLWADMPQGQPMLGDTPLTASRLRAMRLVPVTRGGDVRVGVYTMEYTDRNGVVLDVTDAEGNVYLFDANRMAR